MASSSSTNIPNLDLETGESDYQKFIEAILGICWPVYQQKRNRQEVMRKDLRRTDLHAEELSGGNWVFQVRLSYKGTVLDVLIQKLDLYLVGYKGEDEQWILLQGRFSELVLKAVKHQHEDYVRESAGHLIILIQIICEAARFKPIEDHISQHYLRHETNELSDDMIDMQHFWAKGSREIKDWVKKPNNYKVFWLGGTKRTIEDVLPEFSCIKGITDEETLEKA